MSVPRPFVAPALALVAGIALGLHGVRLPRGVAAAGLLLGASPPLAPAAFAVTGWWATERSLAAAKERRLRGDVSPPLARPPLEPAGAALAGRIASVPDPLGDRVRFRLRSAAGGAVEVLAPRAPWPLGLGDEVLLRATLRQPPGARNPGGRDVRARLAASGIAHQALATTPAVRMRPARAPSWLERGRERLAEAARALPAREAGVVRAIGAGDRGGLDPETSASFARSGLAHVLAVSGMHLVLVAFGLERFLRALLLRVDALASRADPRRVAAAVAVPATLVYAVATGAGPPVLRAAVAAAVVLAGTALDREPDAANTLALAALVLLAADPGGALDVSLQLSFAAVGGLVAWAGPIRRALPLARPPPRSWRARILEPLVAGACASGAASLAAAPVLAFHFRQLPTLGLLANVAAVPIGSALTIAATLAAVAAAAAPALGAALLVAARPLASALLAVSDAAAAPRLATIGVGTPGLAGVAGFYVAAVLATRARRGLRRLAWAAAAACLVAPAHLRATAASARGGLEILFISVGQGDAALLRLPDGSAVLVDAGGAPDGGADPGARDVVPLLRDLGVRRLAAAFLSHAHPDHVLGLAAVAEAFPIDVVFSNGAPGEGEAARVLAPLSPIALAPGDGWARAGVRFDALGGVRDGLGENDASLVLRVSYGDTALLFTGDVEAPGEAAAVARGGLDADVVKVPHHGSRTSSSEAFTRAVHPGLAIVSVGRDNRFGFPHAEAVTRWQSAGATVLRTDEGAIRLLSDGRQVRRVPASATLDPLAILRERP
ncbi:DNA internalization-related competence protein ComEC/Rec2 [Anaeromyxobacter sp. Fw109-5]|uniref:DNA internalization-related competence protein ComEC/Rec2 n=1 Tax=Anaeromyxobacter sp. (strain Fw109-5) TaxID=404589 RepID=UPI0000ED73D4|nr:DNA internalization-related competence protein ComEC/Rec2 [Anaeromyxobacter sp. Fw109-5]ABS26700.1 DNA internalization-related competence protein ComEC/Rec2 [Anaeromyxobacter sp. Fw109-5]